MDSKRLNLVSLFGTMLFGFEQLLYYHYVYDLTTVEQLILFKYWIPMIHITWFTILGGIVVTLFVIKKERKKRKNCYRPS
jgi:hypothetical protein